MSNMKTQFSNSMFIILIIHLIYPLISEVINCDNDWSASHCYHTTISCNETSTTCSINCNGTGSCDGATLKCNNNINGECNINCLGANSCRGTTKESKIYCPSNANCTIFCDGDYSCDQIEIYCPQTSNCMMHANGPYSLVNSYIHCPKTGQCLINCDNLLSCYDGRFDGRNTSQLTINCINHMNACKNMRVGCPQALNHNKRCQINGDGGTIHDEIRLYAINSWDDIDLTRFVGKTGNGENSYQAMMSCDEGYDDQCIISLSSWNCEDTTSICYRDGIYPFPTPVPTHSPSDDNDNGDNVEDWALIIGIIVGCFLFLLFLCLGWIWCVKQQQTENRKYETLEQAPDPDADIMQKQTQHMYKSEMPPTKNSKSFDIATKSGLHIVNEYSDASKFGGLLPISEEKTNDTISSNTSNIAEEKVTEEDALISTTNNNENEDETIKQNKTRDSNVIKQETDIDKTMNYII